MTPASGTHTQDRYDHPDNLAELWPVCPRCNIPVRRDRRDGHVCVRVRSS